MRLVDQSARKIHITSIFAFFHFRYIKKYIITKTRQVNVKLLNAGNITLEIAKKRLNRDQTNSRNKSQANSQNKSQTNSENKTLKNWRYEFHERQSLRKIEKVINKKVDFLTRKYLKELVLQM